VDRRRLGRLLEEVRQRLVQYHVLAVPEAEPRGQAPGRAAEEALEQDEAVQVRPATVGYRSLW
jgi:hypothetical protein